jgi:hypothetical protein
MELLTCQVCFDESDQVKFLKCIHRICPQCETAKGDSDACPVSSICLGKAVLDGRETETILDEKRLELDIIEEKLIEAQLGYLEEDNTTNLPLEDEIEILGQLKEPYPRMSIKSYMMGRHYAIGRQYPGTRRFLIGETKTVIRILIVDIYGYRVFGFDKFGRQIEVLEFGMLHDEDLTPEQVNGARIHFSNAAKNTLFLVVPGMDTHFRIDQSSSLKLKAGHKPGHLSKQPPKVSGSKAIILPNTSYPLLSTFREGQLVVDEFIVYCDSDFHDLDACMDAKKITKRIKYLTTIVSTRRATMLSKLTKTEEQLYTERKHVESVIDSIETFLEYQGKLAGIAQQRFDAVPTSQPQFSNLILTRKYKETPEDSRQTRIFGFMKPDGPEWVVPLISASGYSYCSPLCTLDGVGYALLEKPNANFLQFYNPVTMVAELRFGRRAKKYIRDTTTAELRNCESYVYDIQNGLPLLAFVGDELPETAMIRLVDETLFVQGRPLPIESGRWFSTDFDKREIIIYKVNRLRWSVHNRISF